MLSLARIKALQYKNIRFSSLLNPGNVLSVHSIQDSNFMQICVSLLNLWSIPTHAHESRFY